MVAFPRTNQAVEFDEAQLKANVEACDKINGRLIPGQFVCTGTSARPANLLHWILWKLGLTKTAGDWIVELHFQVMPEEE